MKIIHVAVCKGRHEIPQATDGAIFEQTITEMDPTKLYFKAMHRLTEDYEMRIGDAVKLYVTGLTMATLAIVKVCKHMEFKIVCFHYNKDTGEYIPQIM